MWEYAAYICQLMWNIFVGVRKQICSGIKTHLSTQASLHSLTSRLKQLKYQSLSKNATFSALGFILVLTKWERKESFSESAMPPPGEGGSPPPFSTSQADIKLQVRITILPTSSSYSRSIVEKITAWSIISSRCRFKWFFGITPLSHSEVWEHHWAQIKHRKCKNGTFMDWPATL